MLKRRIKTMNKTVKIILIVAAILLPVGVVVTLLGVFFGGSMGWSINTGSQKGVIMSGVSEESMDLKEFDSLKIDVTSADVNIMRGDSFGISYRTRKGDEPKVSEENGTLTVTQPSEIVTFFSFDPDVKSNSYTITIPDGSGEISLDAVSSSGDIMVDRIKVSGDVRSSSGDVMLNDLDGSRLGVSTSSGEIETDKVRIKETAFSSSSGDIALLRSDTDDMSCSTSSGDIDIYDSVAGKLDCKASSGDVTVELNGSYDDYSYDLQVTSGDIKVNGTEIEGKKYEENAGKSGNITIKTSSGDIELSFN